MFVRTMIYELIMFHELQEHVSRNLTNLPGAGGAGCWVPGAGCRVPGAGLCLHLVIVWLELSSGKVLDRLVVEKGGWNGVIETSDECQFLSLCWLRYHPKELKVLFHLAENHPLQDLSNAKFVLHGKEQRCLFNLCWALWVGLWCIVVLKVLQ